MCYQHLTPRTTPELKRGKLRLKQKRTPQNHPRNLPKEAGAEDHSHGLDHADSEKNTDDVPETDGDPVHEVDDHVLGRGGAEIDQGKKDTDDEEVDQEGDGDHRAEIGEEKAGGDGTGDPARGVGLPDEGVSADLGHEAQHPRKRGTNHCLSRRS